MSKVAFFGAIGELGRLTAHDIMRESRVVAKEGMTVAALARLLNENHVSGVPVVNDDGIVVGVVSQSDVIRKTAEISSPENDEEAHPFFTGSLDKDPTELTPVESLNEITVDSIMTKSIITGREYFTLPEICRVLVHESVHRILILNAAGQLTGIVGSMDIVRVVYQSFVKESLRKKSGRE